MIVYVFLILAAVIALHTLADPHEVALPNAGATASGTALAWPRWVTVVLLSALALLAEVLL